MINGWAEEAHADDGNAEFAFHKGAWHVYGRRDDKGHLDWHLVREDPVDQKGRSRWDGFWSQLIPHPVSDDNVKEALVMADRQIAEIELREKRG